MYEETGDESRVTFERDGDVFTVHMDDESLANLMNDSSCKVLEIEFGFKREPTTAEMFQQVGSDENPVKANEDEVK